MSPSHPPRAVEPGARLVDRYRLEEPQGQTGQTTYWRAHDELLDRPVGVCVLPVGHPNAQGVLSAARLAAAVSDSRFLRVLDANENDGVVYVVSEWVAATDLSALVAERPLTPGHARALTSELAGALDTAHREGLAHLCLTPEHVLRTAHGQVKVAGLAVDAAVRGLDSATPTEAAARDTRGALAVLYAALTAHWPGEQQTALPPAPYDGDRLCSPRQVRAGVPDHLDALVAQGLSAGPRHTHGRPPPEPVRTPGELVTRLAAEAVTSRIPAVRGSAEPHGDTPPPGTGGPYPAPYDDPGPRRGRRAGRAAYILVGLVLLVGVGLAAWQLANLGRSDERGGGPGQSGPGPGTGPTRTLAVASATSLDPPPDGNGEENSDRASLAVDGDPATVWNTNIYQQQLGPGGLKDGVGLLLDLGSRKSVVAVAVTLVGDPTDLQVRVADERGGTLGDYSRAGRVAAASGRAVVRLDRPVRARYVLLWLTRLPPAGGGYRGQVAEVTVRG